MDKSGIFEPTLSISNVKLMLTMKNPSSHDVMNNTVCRQDYILLQ